MHTVNQVVLFGRIGADPDHRIASTGKERTQLAVATDRNIRDGDEWRRETDWHRVVAFDRLAMLARDRLQKGDSVAVVGQLRPNHWSDAQGTRHFGSEVIASRLCFAPRPQTDPDQDLGPGRRLNQLQIDNGANTGATQSVASVEIQPSSKPV